MLVKDIKLDARQVLNYCDDETLYNRLTHAIETLANKGQWEAMTAYMDINVTGNTVTLPREVEFPLKININSYPSFSRAKLYEFSMNGPGNDMQETVSYNWMDKGEVSVLSQPSSLSVIKATINNSSDTGKSLAITGRDGSNAEITETLILNFSSAPSTSQSFKEILRVSKDVTAGNVDIWDSGNNKLSSYAPDETEPFYRRIILSKTAPAIRMLFRRRTKAVTSDNDFIPLQSPMGLLMMLKALEFYRGGTTEQIQKGEALEKKALEFIQSEQESRLGFDTAQTTETPQTLDLNYNNSDSIIVADIYDDITAIFGKIGRQEIFDRLTETLEALNNKGNWDGLTGYVDIITDNFYYVTLPRYVEAPIALNINGMPKEMRNKWFEFHLNSGGSLSINGNMLDDVGDVVTTRPLSVISQFIAKPDLPADDGKQVTIYGYDENLKWIRTQVAGTWQDGFQVILDHTGATPDPSAQKCSRIERITRDVTTGFVQLVAYDPVGLTTTPMGYYYPDETEPNYRRFKLPYKAAWVRMRYRKRSIKITSLTDPIHLKSKLAVLTMMRSMKELSSEKPNFELATQFEAKAVQFLIEEQASRNPNETFDIQFSHQPCHQVII
jgi:hypothetical protein